MKFKKGDIVYCIKTPPGGPNPNIKKGDSAILGEHPFKYGLGKGVVKRKQPTFFVLDKRGRILKRKMYKYWEKDEACYTKKKPKDHKHDIEEVITNEVNRIKERR